MPWWNPWRDERAWRKEWRDAPFDQFRAMTARRAFWQNPDKQRWAERRVWWHDNRRWLLATALTTLAILVGIVAAVGTYLNIYLTHGRS
jgi:hypothetical protein